MIPQDVTEIVDLILNWLNTTGTEIAKAGFDIVVRRVMFLGIRETIIAGFGLLGIIIFAIATKKSMKWAKEYGLDHSYSDGLEYLLPVSLICGIVVSFLIFGSSLVNAVDYFLNPQWHAIKLILGLVQ